MPSGSGLESPYMEIGSSAVLESTALTAGLFFLGVTSPWLLAGAFIAYAAYSFFGGRSKYKKNRAKMREVRNEMVLKLAKNRENAALKHESNKYNYRAEMSAKNRDPDSTISEGFVNAEAKRYKREDDAWEHLQKVMPEQMTNNFYEGGVNSASMNANSVYAYGDQYMQGNQEMYNLFNPPNYSGGGSPSTPGFTGMGSNSNWEQKYYSFA